MITRTEIIQALIDKTGAKSYLEIGTQYNQNFDNIKCDYKVGVDPNDIALATHKMTSDDFFKENKEMFKIVFIDGFHEAYQVEYDILNALGCLEEGGYILCHDMLPKDKQHSDNYNLNGDCWKAFVKLRATRPDLEMCTINTDEGIGIIKKGSQKILNGLINQLLIWDYHIQKRDEFMNVISVEQFKERYL